jgi:hypothetical protein
MRLLTTTPPGKLIKDAQMVIPIKSAKTKAVFRYIDVG